jgi:Asp-tRNA(Asn)/Glu-tRNA(Gln) amidotransferase A subunit family amidase
MSLPPRPLPPAIEPLEPEGLRIGVLTEAGCGLPVDAAILAAVEAAAQLFASAGAAVEPMRPFFTREMLDGLDHFWRLRAYLDISALSPERRARALPFIVQWAMSAAAFDGVKAFKDFSQTMATRKATVAASDPYDYLLSPVSPVPPFPAEWPCPTNDAKTPLDHIAFTVPYNMSEQPAASINCGWTPDGMPIGLQIVARRFDDIGVMRLARWYEMARGEARPWPQPPEG